MQEEQHEEGYKQEQATQDGVRNIAQACSNGLREAKARLELVPARNVQRKKNSFCYYNSFERLNKKLSACCNEKE